MANFNKTLVSSGLGTTTVIVPTADIYVFDGKITLPTITNGGGQSALVVTVNQNGTPVYTGQAAAEGFLAQVACAASDTITIVLSSAAAPDLALNAIKMTLAVSEGAV